MAGASRPKKHKAAIFLGYLGAGYAGMQVNPGQKTIESDLEAALVQAGAIAAANAGSFAKVSWSRAARTDKGVSAVGQLVGLKLLWPHPDMAAAINAHLPPSVRIFGVQRVTGAFDARHLCDRRRYEYVLPAWVALAKEDAVGTVTQQDAEGARQRLDAALRAYEGTHNFHNFTAGMPAQNPAARRYVLSCTCHAVLNIEGLSWLRIKVLGQSFMLHQIRKMVHLAIGITRGLAPQSAIPTALDPKRDISIPMAPELGLFLDACIFQAYNARWGVHLDKLLCMDAYVDQVTAFKADQLYPSIARRDTDDQVNQQWCTHLKDPRNAFLWAREATASATVALAGTSGQDRVSLEQKAAALQAQTAVAQEQIAQQDSTMLDLEVMVPRGHGTKVHPAEAMQQSSVMQRQADGQKADGASAVAVHDSHSLALAADAAAGAQRDTAAVSASEDQQHVASLHSLLPSASHESRPAPGPAPAAATGHVHGGLKEKSALGRKRGLLSSAQGLSVPKRQRPPAHRVPDAELSD